MNFVFNDLIQAAGCSVGSPPDTVTPSKYAADRRTSATSSSAWTHRACGSLPELHASAHSPHCAHAAFECRAPLSNAKITVNNTLFTVICTVIYRCFIFPFLALNHGALHCKQAAASHSRCALRPARYIARAWVGIQCTEYSVQLNVQRNIHEYSAELSGFPLKYVCISMNIQLN